MKTDISDIRDLCLVPLALCANYPVDLDNLISLFEPVIITEPFIDF